MKTGLIKDVISPDEAMKEFEERLEDYGLHKDNEIVNSMTNVLRTRQDAIDIRNLTKYTQTILNKFISNIQTNGARKKNININPRIDD
jgi:chemotaxis receptor (MCP) glutamine deamidase CheD